MYMIMIREDGPDPMLVPYTGAVYNKKSETLQEYLEACEEHIPADVYVVYV